MQLVRFNLFVADLDSAVECTFSKFVGDTKLIGVVDTTGGRMPLPFYNLQLTNEIFAAGW